MKALSFDSKSTSAIKPTTSLKLYIWPVSPQLPEGQIEMFTQDDGGKRTKTGPSVIMSKQSFDELIAGVKEAMRE